MHNHMTACHECDLLVNIKELPVDTNALCPRCGYKLERHKKDSITRTRALVICAAILFIPAMFLPMLSFSIAGNTIVGTVISSIRVLMDDGYQLTALISFFCAVLVPLVSIFNLFFLSFFYKIRRLHHPIKQVLKFNTHLAPWSMLDIYMVGIITSVYKLIAMADIGTGMGLWCFVALFIAVIGANLTFNPEILWEELEAREQEDQQRQQYPIQDGQPNEL